MSVIDKETIDGIAINEDGKSIRLLITDHIEWSDEYNHLLILQEKINAYIAFCEEHQYEQIYKELEVEYAIFEMHFMFEPTSKAIKFLEQVQLQLNEIGIAIECHMAYEENA